MKFIITTDIISHKNLWKRAKWGGLYNSQPEKYNDLLAQITKQRTKPTIETNCRVNVIIRGDNRKDANNQFQTLCDILEKTGVVKNDRLIKEFYVKKIVTKESVGAEIEIII